jgi:hypothetical protein
MGKIPWAGLFQGKITGPEFLQDTASCLLHQPEKCQTQQMVAERPMHRNGECHEISGEGSARSWLLAGERERDLFSAVISPCHTASLPFIT